MSATRFTDIRRLTTVDSTNRYLLDEARGGAPEGVVVVADHQSAGRGRLGRTWEAPAGSNLLMSVLLRPELPDDQRHLASAVVALAAADACGRVAGVVPGVKWPNDLLGHDGRKLAGVLAEADLAPAGRSAPPGPPGPPATAIVVGIGINVNWPARESDLGPDLAGSATSLHRVTGARVDRTTLFEALLEALEPRVADLAHPPGRLRQAADFRARCTTLGTRVRVETAVGWFEGTARDLTSHGHLEVEVDGSVRTVVAGDVVHVRGAG